MPRASPPCWRSGCRSIRSLIIPAYEDIYYYLWRERTLPANVVVEDAKLRDPLERARLARVFSHGLASPVGSVLPLRRVIEDGARRWQSGKWFFRGDTMFLLPGDSPIGLRLPLESLPWVDPETIEYEIEPDPFARAPPFASAQAIRAALHGQAGPRASGFDIAFPPVPQELPDGRARRRPAPMRTALTVESRDGKLHIFLPPLFSAEDWLELVAAIEATAQEVGRQGGPGRLPAAVDPRLLHFSVTPIPG